MHGDAPQHEKIRFRRNEIARLDALPSAAPTPAPTRARRPLWSRLTRTLTYVVLASLVLSIAAIGAVYFAARSGVGNERLQREAQAAITALAGTRVTTAIGSTRFSVAKGRRVGIEIRDAEIASAESNATMMSVGSLRFGLRALPLLRGEVKLGSAHLGNARIMMEALPRADGQGVGLHFLNEDGLLDPDVAAALVFDSLHQAFDALQASGTDEIDLENVEIVFGSGENERRLLVESSRLSAPADGQLAISALLRWGERVVKLEGTASRNAGERRIERLAITTNSEAPEIVVAGNGAAVEDPNVLGNLNVEITGAEGSGAPNRLSFNAHLANAVFDMGRPGQMKIDADMTATVVGGTRKIEIERASVTSGRSRWQFHGAVGPAPKASGERPHYRYELVSDGSVISPEGSSEPALPVLARIAGRYEGPARILDVDEIGLRTAQGEVTGSAEVRFEPGKSPGLQLNVDVTDMPVSHVKQIWPFFAAPGARNWVSKNVYGGRVVEGSVRLGVPPGRMGNGIPFDGDEVSGRFAIAGTRFDMAGRLPPMRDGDGVVEFRGTDVDIALNSGTVFMSDGRTVNASAGTLTIRDAHLNPVIGKLRIGVDGQAPAIMALAGYEPINVERFVDLKPGELSGEVSGTVSADIPLTRNVPVESLGWKVELDYSDLALARPFEGMTVTEAKGRIVVEPTRAAIDADAKLNGAASKVHLVFPLGNSEIARERKVDLVLDDKARDALAPGLDVVLGGTALVQAVAAGEGKEAITADLSRSTLKVPWVGWSKGTGIPGTASFTMERRGSRTELSDFRVKGDTFSAAGAISLDRGGVSSVKLNSAKLNRTDDFSVDVKRQGSGYNVTIRGNSIDVRSVIKMLTADAEGAAKSVEGVPVTVDLAVASAIGFHGETLRDVTLSYRGNGPVTDALEFSATTRNGRKVTFTDGRAGGARNIRMQSADAGSILRFLDIYERMEGGDITVALKGSGGPLSGQVDARNFWVVNEPRLSSLVSTAPASDGRTLNDAVRGEIDVSRVQFERGFSVVEKGTGYLNLDRGVLRGPLIGATFQGSLYDRSGNMAMTGTFMPAYGLNRIFGEIPLIGQILGNGRDRGLIGITFRLAGKAGEPDLQINPLSVIAPGIFRSVFEFR
ncbi:DUF3971 domain-containing protein [Aquamicrobium sp. LC103]|uniref:YhdP family protein n=1 Tax=Aquamicrobium sp. LC103 TaxID=1120658 RepID=UPI00063E9B10|nr:DUF3971 domain-containing protein [Aquamicrobium sp. LC103]TKT79214.1 DUF3971 domain-containing protein [Aquamicrobium sp. LC103]